MASWVVPVPGGPSSTMFSRPARRSSWPRQRQERLVELVKGDLLAGGQPRVRPGVWLAVWSDRGQCFADGGDDVLGPAAERGVARCAVGGGEVDEAGGVVLEDSGGELGGPLPG